MNILTFLGLCRFMSLVFEEDVLGLICGYAPQSGGHLEGKQSFYNELKCE